MSKFLKVALSAAVVAIVVEAIEQYDRRSALLLATVILMLVLITNQDKLAELASGVKS